MKKIFTWLILFWLFGGFVLISHKSNAQTLQITPGVNAATILQELVGVGVTISNVQLTGGGGGPINPAQRPAYGRFKRVGGTMPIDSGLLLTSGLAIGAIGPNNSGSTSNSWASLGGAGDPLLDAIVGAGQTRDACGMNLDIKPIGDKIFFKYSLGSEEYNEFVGGNFNDVFGFFISGPNPAGGNYVDVNIALLPATAIPTTINNVNNTNNSTYYQDNTLGGSPGFATCQYDGYTIGTFAQIAVVPCQTYTLKLRIADRGDNAYDSGVFIEKINSNIPVISALTPTTPLGGLMEGCNSSVVNITRQFTNTSESFQVTTSGSATPLTDYDVEVNGVPVTAFPLVLSFGFGDAQKSLTFKPKNDAIVEPNETANLVLRTICNGTKIDSLKFVILDATNLQPVQTPTTSNIIYRCSTSQVIELEARPAISYTWSSPTGGSFTCADASCKKIIVNSLTEHKFKVELGIGTCVFTSDEITVKPANLVVVPATDPTICIGQTAQLTASGMESYTWSPATGLSCTTCPNPIASPIVTTTYTVTGIVAGTPTPICSNSKSITVNVVQVTPITINLNNSYCLNASAVTMTASQTGGTFTINGTTATQFNPATLGVGTHTVLYTLGSGGCTQTATKLVNVSGLPTLAFVGLNDAYCVSMLAVQIPLNATPAGGIFTVNGVNATDFSAMAAGTLTITYTRTDPATTCSNTITKVVTINPLPTLAFTGLNTNYCITASAFNLTATPAGGTFQINNVNATQFNPTALGVGSHVVKYTFTDVNTCTNSITQTVNVVPLPTLAFVNVKDTYCISSPSFVMDATPNVCAGGCVGGSFQINGANATQFNPATLGLGTHTVKYTFTDGNGCTNSITKTVQIQTKPVLSFTGLNLTYCVNNASFALAASPSGGTFQINGASATQFNPATLGAGTHIVKYNYIDPTDTGCFNEITQNVVVNPLTVLSFTGLNTGYCITASAFNLVASPSGGTFQINGVNATQFNPATLGAGNQVVKYTFTDGNSCTNTITQNVNVNPLPVLTFVNIKESYCISSPSFVMSATPAGGTFKINNVVATTFNPATLGLGAYTVTYDYTDANGCSNQITKLGQIQVKPVLAFTGLNTAYCVNNASFALTATPTGGTFQINGTNATQFNPATLGAGNHVVKYNYIDPTDTGCFNEITQNVVVNPLTTLSFTGLNTGYCVDGSAFNLVASPAGGTFTINNIVSTQFNPAILGVGSQVVKYTFTDANSCVNSITQNVNVNPLPVLAFVNVKDNYCISSPAFNMSATPTGGVFKIDNVVATQFNPSVLGLGSFVVKYDYTDGNGCSNSTSKTVVINTKPTVSFVGLQTEYCADASTFTLGATPTGGTFTINGSNATQFNASTLGAGTYTVKYNYIDPSDAGCFNEVSQIVKINALPVVVFQSVNDKYCVNENATITPQVQITYGNGTTETKNLASFIPNALGVGGQVLTYIAVDPLTNCQKTFTKNITINALPTLSFVGLPDKYCIEARAFALNAQPSGGSFSVNGTTIVGNLDPKIYQVGDILVVRYNFTDGNGCSNSISSNLEIIAPSNFTSTRETLKICPPEFGYELMAMTLAEEIALRNSGKRIFYKWNNGAVTRNFFIKDKGQEGTQSVEVIEDSGCPVLRRTFEVSVNCDPKLFLPTAFTPNGDGLNDTFEIKGGDFAFLNFQIYNRWGEMIYVSRGKEDTWDGTFNGKPCPEGVYVWKAQYENILKKDEKVKTQGMVTLVR